MKYSSTSIAILFLIMISYAGESNLILSREMTREMLTAQMNRHGLGPALGGSGDSITFFHGDSNAGFSYGMTSPLRFFRSLQASFSIEMEAHWNSSWVTKGK